MALGAGTPVAYGATAETYVVLYADQALPGGAEGRVQASGGSVVAAYPDIGVVVARSASSASRPR
jgi:lantibiotic leader peptide-processing serine protease